MTHTAPGAHITSCSLCGQGGRDAAIPLDFESWSNSTVARSTSFGATVVTRRVTCGSRQFKWRKSAAISWLSTEPLHADASPQHGQEFTVEPRVGHEPGDVARTCSLELALSETDHRVDGDLEILVGMMLGHARRDSEQQFYHLGNMRVWRAREAE